METQVHTQHAVEFACLEEQCRVSPLMCYICKEHGRHVNHKFELLDREAEKLRASISSALLHVNKFGAQLSEHARKIDCAIAQIESTPQLVTVSGAGHDEASLQAVQVRLRIFYSETMFCLILHKFGLLLLVSVVELRSEHACASHSIFQNYEKH